VKSHLNQPPSHLNQPPSSSDQLLLEEEEDEINPYQSEIR